MEMRDRYHHGALKDALLKRAMQVIESEGLDSLSLRGLADAIGVSKTAPYRHFASKHALLTSVAAEGFRLLAETLERAEQDPGPESGDGRNSSAGSSGGASAALDRLALAYIEFALGNPAMYRLMFSKYGFTLESPQCRLNSDRAFSVLVRIAGKRMSEGWHAGEDPGSVILSVWALVHGWAGLLNDELIPKELGTMRERWPDMVRRLLA